MNQTLRHFGRRLENCADSVHRLSKNFCQPLGITTFAYSRVSKKGEASWVTSNPDQDQFLLESKALEEEPFFNTPDAVKAGHYLWFNNRHFEGSDIFYHERTQRFKLDHGLVLVRHQKEYIEACCFSGLLATSPLYNLFINEKSLFETFMQHFTESLDRRILTQIHDTIPISHFKSTHGKASKSSSPKLDREALVVACGQKELLKLSSQEKKCLLLLKKGHSYPSIATILGLSTRTVEHYIDSVKNKLNLHLRPELSLAAEKLLDLGLS